MVYSDRVIVDFTLKRIVLMKTKDELVAIIERVVQNLVSTVRGGGKFIGNDDVHTFWETCSNECGLRMVSPSSFDARIVFNVLSDYTRVQKRKGYDCACEITKNIFKACSSSVAATLFKIPFEVNFKETQHQGNLFFGQGYYIRNAHIHDFASASADIIISLGTDTGITGD